MERVWKNKSKDQKALESAIEFFLLSTATAVTVTIAGFARARAICVKLPISQRQTQYTTVCANFALFLHHTKKKHTHFFFSLSLVDLDEA